MADSWETLIVERSGGVVTVTMNRPERKNAANGTMWRELQKAPPTGPSGPWS
jgi:enoyl-CoA hydratase/carnithine racemase